MSTKIMKYRRFFIVLKLNGKHYHCNNKYYCFVDKCLSYGHDMDSFTDGYLNFDKGYLKRTLPGNCMNFDFD